MMDYVSFLNLSFNPPKKHQTLLILVGRTNINSQTTLEKNPKSK